MEFQLIPTHSLDFQVALMHQSIPAVPIPPLGNPGAFPNVARPGGGAFAYLGLTPGHLTRGFKTVE